MLVLSDLRYAVRTLARSPGYTLTCVAVLALGIGANVAIFSVAYPVILAPLPYPDPGRLVMVWEYPAMLNEPLAQRTQVAHRNFIEWKKQNTVFSQMAAFRELSLTEAGRGSHVSTAFVSAELFSILGVSAKSGGLFQSSEERKGSDQVVVLSDRFFDGRFHRDPRTLGGVITLGGTVYTIVGVLPPEFYLPATHEGAQLRPDVWAPLSRLWNQPEDEVQRQLLVAARLKPGVSLEQARTEMLGISGRLAKTDPELDTGWQTTVFPFRMEDSSPELRRALYLLLAAVAFLLLIACVNLANLTLARSALRTREVAVRLALGAKRSRVIMQLIAESFVVSVVGAAAGLLLAHWTVRAMLVLEPSEMAPPRPELIGIHLPVFLFAALASVLTAILFGLAPSILSVRSDLTSALKAGAWGSSASRTRSRQFLIAVEVALALVLVTGAGLMVRSFLETISTGIGIDVSHLIGADLDLPEKRYPDERARERFYRELMNRASRIPGVSGFAVVDNLPLHSVSMSTFYFAGQPDPPLNALPTADNADVSVDYLRVLSLRLEAGRFFTEGDLRPGGDGAVIVNRAFTRKFFGGENPLGKRILPGSKERAYAIVGVVSDYRPMGAENGARPQIFKPSMQLKKASLILRTGLRPGALAPAIRSTVQGIDKDLAATDVKTLSERLEGWQAPRKFLTLLMGAFAALALVLAMIGIYGTLANLVASRVREIGVRMAIGAPSARIAALVLRQGMLPVGIGLALGLGGSFALGRLMESLLYQVHARDPLTLSLSAALIVLVSPLALWVPLRRALRVDCTVALREE